jgi:hypothetical protein
MAYNAAEKQAPLIQGKPDRYAEHRQVTLNGQVGP